MKCIEKEIPFEVPEGWGWCRLGLIGDWCSGATPSRSNPEYYNGNIPWLKTGDLNDSLVKSIPETISELALEKTSVRLNPTGSVLIAMYGATIGKVGILTFPATTNQACCACFPIQVYNNYLFYFLLSNKGNFIKKGEGGAQPNISKEKIVATLIPIPPLSEQYCIVEKLNELLSFIDTIESDKASLQSLIKQAKSKILDLAIRGKLVPQDPNDEPASVLLERIRAEKEELIRQGKVKRDKKESVMIKGEDNSYYEKIGDTVTCIDDELPFEVPDEWCWFRLENCCSKEIKRGKSPKYSDSGNTLVFAQKCNTKYDGIDLDLAMYLDESTLNKYPDDEYMRDMDIVINSTGTGTLGRVGIYRKSDNKTKLSIVPDSHVTVIRTYTCINADYTYYFLKAYQSNLEKMGEGSTNQKELKPLTLKQLLIPLPAFDEQERIIRHIASLFSKIDELEKSLS